MVIVDIGDRRLYWSKGVFEQPFFQRHCASMSVKRFDKIVSCIHYEDRTYFTVEQLNVKRKENPFWQVDSLVQTLSEIFSKYYQLGQTFDIDEMSIYFKGRHTCRCYKQS